jgi:hypothetical protein
MLLGMKNSRSFRVVRLLVASEVILSLQSRVADLADEATFHIHVSYHVLVENLSEIDKHSSLVTFPKVFQLTFPGKRLDIRGTRTTSTHQARTSIESLQPLVAASSLSASSFSSSFSPARRWFDSG